MPIDFLRKAARRPAYPIAGSGRSSTLSVVRRHPARSAGIAGAAIFGAALLALSLQSSPSGESTLADMVEPDLVEELAVAEVDLAAETTPEPTPLANAPLPTIEKATRIALLEPADTAPGLPDDTRWAAAGTSASARTAASELAELLGDRQQDRETDLDAFAQAFDLGPDLNATTGAISTAGGVDAQDATTVAIAESEIEVAALESRMAAQNRDVFVISGADTAPSGQVVLGVVTSYVNLRAAPENEADILKVLPENASVSVIDDCPNWCEVEHEGVRGFVFGSFVDRQAPSTVSAVDQLQ